MKRTRYARKASAFSVMTPSILPSLLAANPHQPPAQHSLRVCSFTTALPRDAACGAHVVVKNAACAAVLESSDAHFSFRRATVTAALWYDCQPPKPVDFVHQAPMEYSVAVVSAAAAGEAARVECRLKVLTSQHEGQLFRIRFTIFDTNTTIVEATSEPIRVISKAEKKGGGVSRRRAPSVAPLPVAKPLQATPTPTTPQHCGKRAADTVAPYDLSPSSPSPSPSSNSSCSDEIDACSQPPAAKYQCVENPALPPTPFATPSPTATPSSVSSTPCFAQPPLFSADSMAQHTLITLAQLVEACPALERDAYLQRAVQGAVALCGSPAALAPIFAEIASALTSITESQQLLLLPPAVSPVFCPGAHCLSDSVPDCALPPAAGDPSLTPFLNVREVPPAAPATAEPPTLLLPPLFAADAFSSEGCFTDFGDYTTGAEVIDCLTMPDTRTGDSFELAAPEDFW
eukprot:TRINITY_DN31_c0_g2_i4.p1 TRINITY_DN31_c0_g2~~TRINITY_DN31_c0_g2_i4.p1  ORF type:complete len:477 (-),score=128.36 TRINITY_DN31_c0_g2_i4:409-1785(-)